LKKQKPMSGQKYKTSNTGVILLAAGNSSRLGRPKQLLSFEGETLLRRCLQAASASQGEPIVLVLGAQAETIKPSIDGFDVHIIENKDWEEGMASSIRAGIKALTRINADAKGCILMVCDQPYVTSSSLDSLITSYQRTSKPIVASSYENTFGPPAFFHHSLFDELMQLKGDVGARSVVQQHTGEVEVIPFPEGTYDVDTEADYESIKSKARQ
jgi:molybdenum cofactor cytidylyltransferase